MGGCDTSVRLIKSQTEEEEGTPLPLLWQLTACDIIHRIKAFDRLCQLNLQNDVTKLRLQAYRGPSRLLHYNKWMCRYFLGILF